MLVALTPQQNNMITLALVAVLALVVVIAVIRKAVSSAENAMNVYYGGVTINVYGHEGQDISALADEIEERININMTRRKAAFI